MVRDGRNNGTLMSGTCTPGPAPSPQDEGDPFARFRIYVDTLADLLVTPASAERMADVTGALDGVVARQLRATVALGDRRDAGAFFTGQDLARKLIAGDWATIRASRAIVDPACGAGDLLLACAQALPTAKSLASTLESWGAVLVGRDINPLFVRTARLRIALMASDRLGAAWRGSEDDLATLLPGIRTGDGTALQFDEEQTLLVVNPPFGAVVAQEAWGVGRLARAAVFMARCLEGLPSGAVVRAVLPDVLRSGANYSHWRRHVEEALDVAYVDPVGRFDPHTDVDVFLLGGVRTRASRSPSLAKPVEWWTPPPDQTEVTVDDLFEIRVGPVVPHRDPVRGPQSPYIRASDLPMGGEYHAGGVVLNHEGRRFESPMVLVRRTSRPGQANARATATLVTGDEPVLVENHLLVCTPQDGELTTCLRLIALFQRPETSAWLDQRLRCRHLTVGALRELPWA
jgi:hypothetical protein